MERKIEQKKNKIGGATGLSGRLYGKSVSLPGYPFI
jgi:hypothetical protein